MITEPSGVSEVLCIGAEWNLDFYCRTSSRCPNSYSPLFFECSYSTTTPHTYLLTKMAALGFLLQKSTQTRQMVSYNAGEQREFPADPWSERPQHPSWDSASRQLSSGTSSLPSYVNFLIMKIGHNDSVYLLQLLSRLYDNGTCLISVLHH